MPFRELALKVISGFDKHLSHDEVRELTITTIRDLVNRFRRSLDIIATIGARRINDGDVILTGAYSLTVLKMLEKAASESKKLEVYVTESRPGSEGLRLAHKLSELGLNVSLFVDSAIRYFMKDVN